MQKKVILIDPIDNEYNLIRKEDLAATQISEPIGVCYVGAVAKENGYTVKIIQQIDETNEEIIRIVKEFGPDFVGLSCMAYNYPNSLEISKAIKKELDVPIIFGGVYPTCNNNIILEPSIDYVISGEGEYSFLELLESLRQNQNKLYLIEGLTYQSEGIMKINPSRKSIEDLDNLPFPLRDDLSIGSEHYKRRFLTGSVFEKQIKASINSSRGCRHNCAFCTSPGQWNRAWRARSPENIVDEVEYLIDRFSVNYIEFRDENFTDDKHFVISLCDEMIKRKVACSWYCQGRIDDVDKDMLRRMKEANCFQIEYGIESGSKKTLKKISKGITPEKAREIVVLTDEIGITTHCLFIIGFPWESSHDLEQTLDFMLSIPYDRIRITYYTPFKGTPLWDILDKDLIIESDLSKYTTMFPVIRTEHLSGEDLRAFRKNAYSVVYNNINFAFRSMKKIKRFPEYQDSFIEWFKVLDSFNKENYSGL